MVYLVKENIEEMFSSIEMRAKHFSAILFDKRIIATGINRYKTSKIAEEFGYKYGEYHAELDALIKVYSEICDMPKDKLEIVNFRINRFKQIGVSRPCPKCLPWVSNTFGSMVYTDCYGSVVKESFVTGVKENVCTPEELCQRIKFPKEMFGKKKRIAIGV